MKDATAEFLKPRLVDVQSSDDQHAQIVIEPLERGFGYTLGNALRRILHLRRTDAELVHAFDSRPVVIAPALDVDIVEVASADAPPAPTSPGES